MTTLSDQYEKFLETFGQPNSSKRTSATYRSAIIDDVPEDFIAFIEQVGFSVWKDGYFQFCDPQKYNRVLKHVFVDDPEFDMSRSNVLGFSAFGHLLVWHPDYRVMTVNFLRGKVTAYEFLHPQNDMSPEASLALAVTQIDSMDWDAYPDYGKPLFKRCLERLQLFHRK